jgi:hypothetical protein
MCIAALVMCNVQGTSVQLLAMCVLDISVEIMMLC